MGDKYRSWVKGLPILAGIWLVQAAVDHLWFAIDQTIPAWDQAEYLTGALNYWQALQNPHWLSSEWWTSLWHLSAKIPPLVYIATVPFLNLFGTGPEQSTLVGLLFSAILLSSVYTLGSYLFTVPVGLWAAGFCVILPGLYHVRLDFLLDYPLAAMVTLCFTCLTIWRGKSRAAWLHQWLLVLLVGLNLGLALMVKQPALFFLLVPLIWAGIETIKQRAWRRLAQLMVALGLSTLVFGSWYRTNWLLMLTAGRRATVDSAIAEGDPSLLSLNAWTYYLKALPAMVSLPLLLVSLVGFLLFWRQSLVSCHWSGEPDYGPKTKNYRQQAYAASKQSLRWLGIFVVGGYLLSSLNINKDTRYVVPYLPVVALILAYGFILLPRRWQWFRWGTIGLTLVLMLYNLVSIPWSSAALKPGLYQQRATLQAKFPHAEVISEVINTSPYLRSNVGVLPSTGEINQHNINYYGNLRDFQVYGRQVGVSTKFVSQDQRSMPWFITKTGTQGSIRYQEAHDTIMQAVEQGTDFRLHKTWTLPDASTLKLFQRQLPLLEVSPIAATQTITEAVTKGEDQGRRNAASLLPPSDIRLDQILLPDQAPPGRPVPVTYKWSGALPSLQTGLVVLTWQRQGTASTSARWFHDHGLGMGMLYAPQSPGLASRFQVVERTAMLPPATLPTGDYTLSATYLDRQTGKASAIVVPPIRLRITPDAAATPAPELDLSTQLRTLSRALPQGGKQLDAVFSEIGRINQYDPVQDYVVQTQQAITYRLQQEPNNLEFLYALALANVLKRQVNPAINVFQQISQLDHKNPYAYAYLAFVNLYDFRPISAQSALKSALALNPTIPEFHALSAIAAGMQGNFLKSWQDMQVFQKLQSRP